MKRTFNCQRLLERYSDTTEDIVRMEDKLSKLEGEDYNKIFQHYKQMKMRQSDLFSQFYYCSWLGSNKSIMENSFKNG